MLQGLATFPGVRRVLACEYTLAPGIRPSTATLTIAPQEPPASAAGQLEFTYGNVRISLADCRVASHRFETTEQGRVWRLTLVDRRWSWAWGAISGRYNVRRADGSLDPAAQRTPQELAALCLEALGERGFDVGLLPNDARPAVAWDHAPPAQALERLAASLGARVVLRLDGSVALWPIGLGRELPLGPQAQTFEQSGAAPPRPGALAVVCGRTRFQHDFPLEAVGLDRDGTARPIDQLAYRPRGGWKTADLPHFNQVSDPLDRRRARESVFRWYRIRAAGLTLPGFGPITDLAQILPLETAQVDTVDQDGRPQAKPAQVWGIWHDPQRDATLANGVDRVQPLDYDESPSARRALIHAPRTIDTRAAIVKFSVPVYKLSERSDGFELGPAELVLRTAVGVRPAGSDAPVRHERWRLLDGSPAAPVQMVSHAELVRTIVPQFAVDYALQGLTDNRDALDRACDAVLDAVAGQYAARRVQAATYVGLAPLEPDGAIDAVTFAVGPTGCTTRAIRG